MDLRGLAALFGKINALLSEAGQPSDDTDSLDLFGLSRFLQRRGEPARAHSACSHALALGLPSEYHPQARSDLAMLAKNRGDHQQAAQLWHELAADDSAGLPACIQLAIHYERRAKQLDQALAFARLALKKVRNLKASSSDSLAASRNARLEQRILNRVARLEHRMTLWRVSSGLPSVHRASSGRSPEQSGSHNPALLNFKEESGWKPQQQKCNR
jgi:tetratricopeptide (TPR) repeat protein